ncbi:MAG: M48 family metallopeptidase [Scytonema sp. PMC 1069.18]|nr:M48 family metallopeptidase [Scytonema sp. PMC 1069.18]MEC4883241.1 M48 family metallopeptidase [Scytonema sp. PMC 1070.18]
MRNWKTTLLSISSICLIWSPNILSVQAKPVAPKKPDAKTTSVVYERAKQELPSDFYALYRIVDRVARANGYDENPWRIAVLSTYDINAFATDVNLIAIHNGILDQLAGDSSALACVVSHEMGHHVKRHIAIGQAKKAELIAQIRAEAEKEVLGEKRAATSEATATAIGGEAIDRAIPGAVGNFIGNVLGNQSRNRITKAQQRIDEIVAKKTQELEQRLAEQSRQHEFEADEVGYIASVQAGFEPEGCLRAMAVLAKTPGAEFDSGHPAVPKRIEALKALAIKYPPQTLVREGNAKITATQPLTYDLSRDKASLRINSRRGGSVVDDIDRRFGK